MIILAFLQNLKITAPGGAESVSRYLDRHPAARRRFIRHALFPDPPLKPSLTGRRLLSAFGPDLCGRIVWEEASPKIAADAKTVFKPDLDHMRAVCLQVKPNVVISFGALATEAVKSLALAPDPGRELELMFAPHPAARQADTRFRLAAIARRLVWLSLSEQGRAE